MKRCDLVVTGQGLAGSALLWAAQRRGLSAIAIDAGRPNSCSRVAAGLITPLTGARAAESWRYGDFFPAARSHYAHVEAATGARAFSVRESVRLFASAAEREAFAARPRPPSPWAGPIESGERLVNSAWFRGEHGGFAMADAARLDAVAYLDATAAWFRARGGLLEGTVDADKDVEFGDAGVRLPRFGVEAEHLVFADGLAARGNPFAAPLRFNPAKGEILTVSVPGLEETRLVQRGVWLQPIGGDRFLAGATYRWGDDSDEPSPAGAAEIAAALALWLVPPFTVLEVAAGIRPILQPSFPVIGVHPERPRVAFLNGLGSKGALQAPLLAEELLAHLYDGAALAPEIDFRRRACPPRHDGPLTALAHRLVAEILSPGETALDGTAGNGADTLGLALAVGPTGKVHAFDIQPDAIARTTERLRKAKVTNVTLWQRSHSEIDACLPPGTELGAAMFNLGYLPAGDRSIVTTPGETIPALDQAARRLRRGGILTIIAYPGHPGGESELAAVRDWISRLSRGEFARAEHEGAASDRPSPVLIEIRRLGESDGD